MVTGRHTHDQLLAGFEACTLPADEFPHREHVRLAWIYLDNLPTPEVLARYEAGLKRFAKHHGADGLYHTTITWSYVLLIAEARQRLGPEHTWDEFSHANPDLLTWRPTVLDRYYTKEVLDSDLARTVFVMPTPPVAEVRP